MLSKLHPVHALPDYLKLELGANENVSGGFLAALAQVVDGLSRIGEKQTLSADPHLSDPAMQRRLLKLCGIEAQTFSPAELPRLVDNIQALRMERGSLRAVVRLAGLFFGNVRVRRGRGLARTRLRTPELTMALSEARDRDRILLIRVEQESPAPRIEEYLKSVKGFVPDGYDVLVAGGKQVIRRERIGVEVGVGFKLQGRRL